MTLFISLIICLGLSLIIFVFAPLTLPFCLFPYDKFGQLKFIVSFIPDEELPRKIIFLFAVFFKLNRPCKSELPNDL